MARHSQTQKSLKTTLQGKFLPTVLDDPDHWKPQASAPHFYPAPAEVRKLEILRCQQRTVFQVSRAVPRPSSVHMSLLETQAYWNCPGRGSLPSVRVTPSLALEGRVRRTCHVWQSIFVTPLPIVVRPDPAALPFHENPGPALGRKQAETSWVRAIATQNSTGKRKAFWTYFKWAK